MPTLQNLNSYSDLELALMILLGYFGNGSARKSKLGSRYAAAQGIVEQILRGTVPAGSGNVTAASIEKAVRNTFQDCINEITEEIVNAVK